MDSMKNIAMIAAGSIATLAYQKYSKPVMRNVKKVFNGTMKKVDKTLDDMM